jgi:hypothetical protein
MDQLTRQDAYRQLRVLIDPAPTTGMFILTVVARTSHRGSHRDQLLLRRTARGDLQQLPIGEALNAVAAALAHAADTQWPPTA